MKTSFDFFASLAGFGAMENLFGFFEPMARPVKFSGQNGQTQWNDDKCGAGQNQQRDAHDQYDNADKTNHEPPDRGILDAEFLANVPESMSHV